MPSEGPEHEGFHRKKQSEVPEQARFRSMKENDIGRTAASKVPLNGKTDGSVDGTRKSLVDRLMVREKERIKKNGMRKKR